LKLGPAGQVLGDVRLAVAHRLEYLAIPQARYVSNQDNPPAFNAAMTAFLDRTLARSSARPIFGPPTPSEAGDPTQGIPGPQGQQGWAPEPVTVVAGSVRRFGGSRPAAR
jgi:hypothetical protein